MSPSRGELVVLGLGSNLGDRLEFLRKGVERLERGGVGVERISSVYETPPLGYLHQPAFLNLVLAGRTKGSPGDLMGLLREVEAASGRVRSFRDAPRTLDVDLIFFGRRIVRAPGIRVPHPRWKGRSFVVRPLAEILPGFRDPETGFRVEEVARLWPLEPREIRRMEAAGVLRDDVT